MLRLLLPFFPVLLILGFGFLSGCRDEQPRQGVMTEPQFRQDGTLDFLRPDGSVISTIAIEIADTEQARQQGLMHRRSMPERSGMLFLFDQADTLSFWMRNTPLPLDIIFVAPDSQVVSIARRTRPFSEDQIRAEGLARYVVEVRAGFADRVGIDENTSIRWRRD
jgi:uncharacterized protein